MKQSTCAGFTLVGLKLESKTTNEGGQSGIDCGILWQKFEKENFSDRIPNKLGDEIYAVYFDYEGDHTKPFSYFIGCKVKDTEDVPAGMTRLEIPGQEYQQIIAKGTMPDCVANSRKAIWKSNVSRTFTYDFEMYDERSKDWSDATVEIYISTK